MNQLGGVLGGPLTLPKIYNGHDRTFFFLDYQGTSRIQGTPYQALVPADLQKQGIFSTNIWNPFTTTTGSSKGVVTKPRQQFSYMGQVNRIDPSLLNPVALQIQKYYPRAEPGWRSLSQLHLRSVVACSSKQLRYELHL